MNSERGNSPYELMCAEVIAHATVSNSPPSVAKRSSDDYFLTAVCHCRPCQ
jgi:hypothetical protein